MKNRVKGILAGYVMARLIRAAFGHSAGKGSLTSQIVTEGRERWRARERVNGRDHDGGDQIARGKGGGYSTGQ
jgi:hypothetical protein